MRTQVDLVCGRRWNSNDGGVHWKAVCRKVSDNHLPHAAPQQQWSHDCERRATPDHQCWVQLHIIAEDNGFLVISLYGVRVGNVAGAYGMFVGTGNQLTLPRLDVTQMSIIMQERWDDAQCATQSGFVVLIRGPWEQTVVDVEVHEPKVEQQPGGGPGCSQVVHFVSTVHGHKSQSIDEGKQDDRLQSGCEQVENHHHHVVRQKIRQKVRVSHIPERVKAKHQCVFLLQAWFEYVALH
jgi:hypothetical protein